MQQFPLPKMQQRRRVHHAMPKTGTPEDRQERCRGILLLTRALWTLPANVLPEMGVCTRLMHSDRITDFPDGFSGGRRPKLARRSPGGVMRFDTVATYHADGAGPFRKASGALTNCGSVFRACLKPDYRRAHEGTAVAATHRMRGSLLLFSACLKPDTLRNSSSDCTASCRANLCREAKEGTHTRSRACAHACSLCCMLHVHACL